MLENIENTERVDMQAYINTPVPKRTEPESGLGVPLPPEILNFGEYTLHRQRIIGQGGEATVWLYIGEGERPVYAIVKCARIPDEQMLRHQLHIAQRVEALCGGIRGQIQNLRLTGSEEDEELLIHEHMLVLPYINGVSLSSVLHERALNPEICAQLGARISGRIEHLHREGIVHADIKPDNVILTIPLPEDVSPDISVELIDYSHAANLLDNAHRHVPGGTPLYLSPEQWDAFLSTGVNVGPPTDVYAFGHTLFQMGAGETLVPCEEGDTLIGLREKHMLCAEGRYDDRIDLLPSALRPVLKNVFRPAVRRPAMTNITRRLRAACIQLGIHPDGRMLNSPGIMVPGSISSSYIADLLSSKLTPEKAMNAAS